jgi:vesicle-associated membrane protein 7
MLIFALVSRGDVVLAEHANGTGNFTQVAQAILERVPTTTPTRVSYVYDHYLFHCTVSPTGVIFMIMAEESMGRRIPFLCLDDIQARFESTYGVDMIRLAPAYGMNEFRRHLEQRMEYYSTNPEADRLRQVQGEIEDVKTLMVENIGACVMQVRDLTSRKGARTRRTHRNFGGQDGKSEYCSVPIQEA